MRPSLFKRARATQAAFDDPFTPTSQGKEGNRQPGESHLFKYRPGGGRKSIARDMPESIQNSLKST